MNTCLFVSDLHGKMSRYITLLKVIKKEKPDFVFIGGDILPHQSCGVDSDSTKGIKFVQDFLIRKFSILKEKMDCTYPDIFIIPGNDDHKIVYDWINEGEKADLWRNLHNKCIVIGKYRFYGYACVPPSPFAIKDWERFDINKHINPNCISPANGYFSMPPEHDPKTSTIENELQLLLNDDDLKYGVFLFHSPPFETVHDQALLKNNQEENNLLTSNVGSKAIRLFIDHKQPYITMHGHIHESARISGEWKQIIGRTLSFSAAHDGPELAVVKFELHEPLDSTRRLIKT